MFLIRSECFECFRLIFGTWKELKNGLVIDPPGFFLIPKLGAYGAEHSVLLFYTEVRWLSHGRVLTRVMDLHEQIARFLQDKGNEMAATSKVGTLFLV